MIQTEYQLERAYDTVSRLIRQRDQALQEPSWEESLRHTVAAGIEAQRRKVEREIADYLSAKLLAPTTQEPLPAHQS
jgi:uncharacterized protein YcaQ